MKVCVTSEGKTMESKVDPRFGRCSYFIFVDSETLEFKALSNPNLASTGGAGVQSGQLAASEGVMAVITGDVGPNAYQTLAAGGVEIFTGASGTVSEAVEKFKSKALQKTSSPSVGSKFGMPGKNE